MSLPKFQTDNQDLNMLQSRWSTILNPVVVNPFNSVKILKSVSLKTGSNQISHLLSKPLQGWVIVRQRGPASIYDTQDSNQHPQLTLVLNSSADVVVDLGVF